MLKYTTVVSFLILCIHMPIINTRISLSISYIYSRELIQDWNFIVGLYVLQILEPNHF